MNDKVDLAEAARPQNRQLHSWKEVADRLGVTARTAQKWEKERGLPVRRLPGGHGRIFAIAEELDAWKLSREKNGITEEVFLRAPAIPGVRGHMKMLRWAIIIAGLLAIPAASGLYLVYIRHGHPVRWRIENAALIISDARGHDLWHLLSDYPLTPSMTPERNESVFRLIWIGDVDGDGGGRDSSDVDPE